MTWALAVQILCALISQAPTISADIKAVAAAVKEHGDIHGALAADMPLSQEHAAVVSAAKPDWFDSSAYQA